MAIFDPIFVSHRCVIVMSADYPGPLFIDRSSVTRQATLRRRSIRQSRTLSAPSFNGITPEADIAH
jgi:hypothetical protein